MNPTGVVAALAAEARTLGVARRLAARQGRITQVDAATLICVSGMGRPAARAAARALIDAGAGSLVSWGLAGGLDPMLKAGTICLPAFVLTEDNERFATEVHRREALSAAVAGRFRVNLDPVLTSTRALDTVSAKAAAFRASGAAAVDMESAAIAHVAAELGCPFIAVRVIVDTADDVLPPAVMAASRDGVVRVGRLLLGLARAPGDLPALWRLSNRYRAARQALIGVARSGALAPLALASAARARVV